MIRLIHRIWLAFRGDGREKRIAKNMVMISPKFDESRKITVFLMLA